MTADYPAPIEREMGYSVDEFTRTLYSAMRDWSVSVVDGGWVIELPDDGGHVELLISPLPERRIGALSLPVLAVRIDLSALQTGLRHAFMTRFDRCFHRGGG